MKRNLLILGILLWNLCGLFSQEYFRSGIFLHHSTGMYIWGPNPDGTSTTTIPEQMQLFNTQNGLTGAEAVQLNEEWWAPDDNEWSTQHAFFEGTLLSSNLSPYLASNKILVVKSCFPSSEIDSWGLPSDTSDPSYKSVCNYKWHWYHIMNVMKSHPENFFVIWTNAPLEPNSTYGSQALLAKSFCKWAKDTLAAGLDPVFGPLPENVYVFDYFSKLTGANGMELTQYATGAGDSHPNGAATDLVAPQFVNEVFNAALAYEQIYNSIPEHGQDIRLNCYPVPAGNVLSISLQCQNPADIMLEIYDERGIPVKQQLFKTAAGKNTLTAYLADISAGACFYRLVLPEKTYTGKFIRR